MFRILFILALVAPSEFGCQPEPAAKKPAQPQLELDPRDSLTIEQLVATINNDEPNTHPDYTPSVCDLMEKGLDVIPHVLPLMLSENEETRSRAQTVLQGVVARDFGFKLGQGWTAPGGEENWNCLLVALGSLDAEGSRDAREVAIEKWTKWFNSKKKKA